MHITHPLAPEWDKESRILILGTMPSPASRQAGFYYMHSQNQFWPVLAAVYKASLIFNNNGSRRESNERHPASFSEERQNAVLLERKALLKDHHIALWDVLSECEIKGAADTSIKKPAANNIAMIVDAAHIEKIYTTGQTAYKLYRQLCEPYLQKQAVYLPSTSPANRGRWPFEKLVTTYRSLLLAETQGSV